MTNRRRLLAILDGKSPDRIPWIPRLQLWYNARRAEGTMPARFAGMTLRDVEHALRVGTPARDGRIFAVRYEGVEIVTKREGRVSTTRYVTPFGTVSRRVELAESLVGYADDGLDVEYPIKGERDYDVWEYVAEHTYYDPMPEAYRAYDAGIGEDGLPLVDAGDCPFHCFLMSLAGYQQGHLELFDRPHRVERLLRVMTDCDRERLWPVVAGSEARLILHGVHFDSQLTPPRLFAQYIEPYYREFSAILHAHGKSLAFHADNDSRLILPHVRDAGFDMAECFTTQPMVRCTLAQARAAWGNDVIIWGALPSTLLEATTPEEQFEEYVRGIFRTVAPGDAFILGIADNAMPLTLIERVERVSELVEEYGGYPLSPNDGGLGALPRTATEGSRSARAR